MNFNLLAVVIFLVNFITGYDIPGDEETDVDLLTPLENLINTDPRVYRTKGLDGLPAVGIQRGVEIVVPYRIYLPRKFYKNFAIVASIKPKDNQGGYLFAVVNAFDTVVDLGLLLAPAGRDQTNISLVYTDSQTQSHSTVIASFLVPAFTNQWTQMALEVVGDSVALYFRCMRFATRQVRRHPEQLQMDDASKLYIANAGPILGGGFEGAIQELKLHDDPAEAANQCNEDWWKDKRRKIKGDEGSGFEKSFESSKSTPQNDGRDDNRLDDDDRDRTPKIGQQPRTTQKPFTERFQTTTEVSTRPEYVRDGFSPIYPENTADFGDSLILPFVEFNQQSSQTSMPTRDSNDPGIRHEHSVFAPSSKSNENSEEAQSTEIGQLAFSKSSQQLYIRVNNGWKEVKLEGFHSMVEQRPPVTAKTVYEQPPPVYHEPKVIVETQPEIRTLAPPPQVEQKQVKPEIHRPRIHHRDKIIHLIALNRSISGNMRGIRGADLMCYQQARQAGFKTTFRAFISSRVQDLLQIVHREDRDTPVVNIRGEKLFEDWASVFTQTSMPSNVPIYSFTYRDVLQGDEWPDKYIWHGSDEQGLRTDGFYCEDWRSSSGFAHGMASALLRGRPLITDAEKISCRRELIVLCVENMSKFNVNRLLRGKQRKFRY